MKDIYKVHDLVEVILEEDPQTRNSDMLLWLRACQKSNPIACALPLEKAIVDRKALGLPKPETVGRARRKIQAERPELRAIKEVEDARFENFKTVRKYAI